MKLRKNFQYSEGNKTFTVRKVEATYKGKYLVSVYNNVTTHQASCQSRYYKTWKEAREGLFSVLRLYTGLTKTQMWNL